jgi:hypothetical protein
MTLADGLRRPWKLVVRAGEIYWTEQSDGTVMKMPSVGGPQIVVAERQSSPVALDVDDRAVYWTSVGVSAIRFLTFDAGATVQTLATDQDAAANIRVREGVAYWTNDSTGEVRKAAVAGGPPVTLASGLGSYGLAVDAEYVYWTDDVAGTVMKVPLGGGTPTVIASGQQSPTEIAVDDHDVYWIDSVFDGALLKAAK